MKQFCTPKDDCVFEDKNWTCVFCGRKLKPSEFEKRKKRDEVESPEKPSHPESHV